MNEDSQDALAAPDSLHADPELRTLLANIDPAGGLSEHQHLQADLTALFSLQALSSMVRIPARLAREEFLLDVPYLTRYLQLPPGSITRIIPRHLDHRGQPQLQAGNFQVVVEYADAPSL